MMAPESGPRAYLVSVTGGLPKPMLVEVEEEGSTPASTLADLYRRCGVGGGCPYTLGQIIRVLAELGSHGTGVVATEIAGPAGLPAKAVYGRVLELEDYGLARWIPEPVLSADHITAEITDAGLRFLRGIGGRTHA